jgi:hypothetical protein
MKANTFFLVLWTMGCLTSCRQFLEVRPTDFITAENYYNTEAELQTALNGVYDRLGDDKIYGSNLSYWLTVENDETYHNASNYGPVALYNYNASDPNVDSFWANLYYGIERANLLLANINKPREISESRRNTIRGEALFLRAYFYFLLVTNFGDVPLKLEPNSSVVNTAIARTPQQKVYEQIIADMTTAEGLLQNQTATSLGYGGKVTRTAVQGILARVCLSMAGYPLRDESKFKEALNWCQKVIDSKEHSLNPDYSQIFINYCTDKYDVKESIWEVEMWGNATGGYNDAGQGLGYLFGIANTVIASGRSAAVGRYTKWAYDLFEVNANSSLAIKPSFDLRRDWSCANFSYSATLTIVPNTNPWNMNAGKWRRTLTTESPKTLGNTPINVPLLRYSDVLLMYAEAANEVNNGPTQTAIDYVNQIRRRGYGKYLNGANSVAESIKTITVTNGGSGYSASQTNPVLVTVNGGGGSGAQATAIIGKDGSISGISLTDVGKQYTGIPAIEITGGGGKDAKATAVLTNAGDADLKPDQTGAKDKFLKAIQDERVRELSTEGRRLADLKRWGIFLSKMQELSVYGKANAAPGVLFIGLNNISDKNLLLPVPNRELGVNNLLKQNPGW